MSDQIFEGLNPAQREAVEAVRGPVAILAGAGTGKTTTITRRIAHQVATGTFEPNQILAVTFSVKAAREMGARLGALGVRSVRANTFHAEALAQFRRFSTEQPDILSSKGQILHSLTSRLPMPHKFTSLRDLAGEIEWAKNRRIPARDYLASVGTHEPPIPPELMHRMYVEYEKRKRKASMIDFEDLLEQTVQILESDERALGVVRSRYAAFTIDEYQDVNLLQQSLLDAWVGARDDVCVVGDDYQAVFGFTGATPAYLLKFPDKYSYTTVVTLTDNYRSTPEILTVANRLVPLLGGSRKTLSPVKSSGPGPQVRAFETGRAEVAWVVAECKRLAGDGVRFEDMAVLYRVNGRSEDFEEGFAAAGVPYQVRDGSFLARPAARAFAARARAAAAREPVVRDIDITDARVAEQPGSAPAAFAVAEAAVASPVAVATTVEEIARALGWDPAGEYDAGDEATRQADLARLVAIAREYPGDRGLTGFMTDVRARFTVEEEGRGVQLMTYHRSKGLEFEAVFLPRLEDRELPFALSTSPEDIAEERRLLYVGITRAKRHLSLSYAQFREGERRTRPKPSPFLAEVIPRDRGNSPAPALPRPAGARAPAPGVPPEDQALFDALKAWRGRAAREAELPAYVIFHDATLSAIAAARPGSQSELRTIPGVGPLKMQRYGEIVLSLIAETPEGAPTASVST